MQDEGKSFFSVAVDESQAPEPLQSAETTAAQDDGQGISWTASEFLEHQKAASWYIFFGMAVATLAGVSFLLTKDIFTPFAVLVLGMLFGFAAQRRPRVLEYRVDPLGVIVGARHFDFEEFQSFSINQEGSIESIVLRPAKRWAPLVTMYFAPADGQKIFDALSDYVPFEEHQKDSFDSFLHRIRF